LTATSSYFLRPPDDGRSNARLAAIGDSLVARRTGPMRRLTKSGDRSPARKITRPHRWAIIRGWRKTAFPAPNKHRRTEALAAFWCQIPPGTERTGADFQLHWWRYHLRWGRRRNWIS